MSLYELKMTAYPTKFRASLIIASALTEALDLLRRAYVYT